MKIDVMSEKMISKYTCDEPHVVISIRSPDRLGKPAFMPKNKNRKGLIYLEFHDITDQHKDMDGLLECFSEAHAERIAQFVLKHKDIPRLIVNCEMGISRSAGVAAAVSKFLHDDDTFFFKQYVPNRTVYKILLENLMNSCEKKEN